MTFLVERIVELQKRFGTYREAIRNLEKVPHFPSGLLRAWSVLRASEMS